MFRENFSISRDFRQNSQKIPNRFVLKHIPQNFLISHHVLFVDVVFLGRLSQWVKKVCPPNQGNLDPKNH
jgi:hypothetical protein